MPLGHGTRLGPYEVISAIGAGGMGEVYRARDTRLQRDVAIKVLPTVFSSDPERLARFEQEARAAAALNHPNILAVHDVGTYDGAPYLVSELLEGEPLREQIGSVPVRKVIDYAIQIARGLAAAHDKGIVHRDLKPENIFVTTDGRLKILDFGLAKLTQNDPATGSFSALPTTPPVLKRQGAAPETGAGVVLGTVGYMAPEQVRGLPSDHRADIFALGAILYEMLSGSRAFEGETSMDTMTAILKDAPRDIPTHVRHIPPGLVRVVHRCLEKKPSERFQSSRDLVFALEDLSSFDSSVLPVASQAVASRIRLPWIVATVAAVLAAVLAVPAALYLMHHDPTPVLTRLDIITPPTTDQASIALSPDGKWIVFAANTDGKSQLWLRALDSSIARPLAGTEEGGTPFWSPDSRSIGFFSLDGVKRIDLSGGPPRTIARSIGGGVGGSWSRDGTIIFHQRGGAGTPIERVSENGGETVPVADADATHTALSFPQFLPNGRHFIYFALQGSEPGEYVGALDDPRPKRLVQSGTAAIYSSGYLLTTSVQGTLLAQRFDPDTLTLTGEQIQLATNVQGVTASDTGLLAYRPTPFLGRRQLAWFDRTGKMTGTVGTSDDALFGNPQLSPDDRYVAFERVVEGNGDVWLLDVVRDVTTRFTSTPGADTQSVWSPDGGRLAFASLAGKPIFNIFVKPTSGVGAEQMLLDSPVSKFLTDWSRDGKWLLYQTGDLKTGRDLWVMPIEGDQRPVVISNTEFEEREGQFSPDGRWVAYASSVSGRFEIYVQPFPNAVNKWQISTMGGEHPRWRRDGKELFYLAPDGALMVARVALAPNGESVEPEKPVALFTPKIVRALAGMRQQYAVTADGQKFLIVVPQDTAVSSISIIQNWTETVKQ